MVYDARLIIEWRGTDDGRSEKMEYP
jgi:hypothetical protein